MMLVDVPSSETGVGVQCRRGGGDAERFIARTHAHIRHFFFFFLVTDCRHQQPTACHEPRVTQQRGVRGETSTGSVGERGSCCCVHWCALMGYLWCLHMQHGVTSTGEHLEIGDRRCTIDSRDNRRLCSAQTATAMLGLCMRVFSGLVSRARPSSS